MTSRVCTCAGTAPGYPQHEWGCGQPTDRQEDAETGHCTGCGCTIWNDTDLCEGCDCGGDYRRLAAIHAAYLPVYLPPCEADPMRPGSWHDSLSSATGLDTTEAATP